jgi:hypothetical protein
MRTAAVALLLLVAASASAQISSPPPAALRAGSGTPLAETFTPDTLFPKKTEPPPPAAAKPADVPNTCDGPDDGLLPLRPPPKIWFGSADFGLNGANGNSDLLNVRATWNVRRKTDDNVFTSDLQYVYSQQDAALKAHQALFNTRDEILFPGSRWSAFGAGQLEYDQLRAYRFRVGSYLGVGFAVTDTPDMVLKLRAGAGATHEIGTQGTGTPERWVPELLFGYDFRYKLNDRSTFVSILDYYPKADDPRQWRMRARSAYEYILDPARGAFMRLGVQERYDSDPGNAKRNDINYFATMGIKF